MGAAAAAAKNDDENHHRAHCSAYARETVNGGISGGSRETAFPISFAQTITNAHKHVGSFVRSSCWMDPDNNVGIKTLFPAASATLQPAVAAATAAYTVSPTTLMCRTMSSRLSAGLRFSHRPRSILSPSLTLAAALKSWFINNVFLRSPRQMHTYS